jgi:hypothetical protein
MEGRIMRSDFLKNPANREAAFAAHYEHFGKLNKKFLGNF